MPSVCLKLERVHGVVVGCFWMLTSHLSIDLVRTLSVPLWAVGVVMNGWGPSGGTSQRQGKNPSGLVDALNTHSRWWHGVVSAQKAKKQWGTTQKPVAEVLSLE